MFFYHPSPAAGLDQQGYQTAALPDLPLPRHTGRAPSAAECQEIKHFVQRMLSFEPGDRPAISEMTTVLTRFSNQFPLP